MKELVFLGVGMAVGAVLTGTRAGAKIKELSKENEYLKAVIAKLNG